MDIIDFKERPFPPPPLLFLMGRWEMPSQLDVLMDVSRACFKVFRCPCGIIQAEISGQKKRENMEGLPPSLPRTE